jgi:hypothetical protein
LPRLLTAWSRLVPPAWSRSTHSRSWSVSTWATGSRRRARSPRCKPATTTIRTIGKWLVNTERQDRDPFRLLKLTYVGEGDTVHDRTAFTGEQIQLIVNAARSGPIRTAAVEELPAICWSC